jgi:hypothetical protein
MVSAAASSGRLSANKAATSAVKLIRLICLRIAPHTVVDFRSV